MIRIRQIYYKNNQKLFNLKDTPDFIPLFNPSSDHFLESGVIARMCQENDHKGSDYYGVVSHKFFKKLKKPSHHVITSIDNEDVYSFFGRLPKVNLVKQGDSWHPLFSEIYNRIAELMKWDIDFSSNIVMEPIYSNHWVAKSEIYERYCRYYLIPVMNFMESDDKLREFCFEDANYINREKLSPELCLKVFSRPYYTYHCFILERLFSIFCYLENITVKHI